MYFFLDLGPDGTTRLVTTPKAIMTDSNVINQNSLKIQPNSQIITSRFKYRHLKI